MRNIGGRQIYSATNYNDYLIICGVNNNMVKHGEGRKENIRVAYHIYVG